MSVFKIFSETLKFALNALSSNRLRSILSLFGISIGIFAIISIFTVIDSLENNIRSNIDKLGKDVIYISKWPWSFSEGYPWWKYYQRPSAKFQELKLLQDQLSISAKVAFISFFNSKKIKYFNNDIEEVKVQAISHDYRSIIQFDIIKGRFFSTQDSDIGNSVVIIGYNIYKELFNLDNPIGKEIKFMGQTATVIGVLEKVGESFVGENEDDKILIPLKFARKFAKISKDSSQLLVKSNEDINKNLLKIDIIRVMRSIRRLSPRTENNFSLNEISLISRGLDILFYVINFAGIIIGGFSLLVGGFGIANIMYVSVKERTNLIGIQKSLGAKNYFILIQFLFESVLLCLIGGLIGLSMIVLCVMVFNIYFDLNFILSFKNILSAVLISFLIGVISGILPAIFASKLNPVDAIRSK